MKKTSLILACLFPAAASHAANIAFVSFHSTSSPDTAAGNAGFTTAPDIGYTTMLQNAGHTVTRFLSSATPNTATLNSFDLVIISRSVASANYQFNTTTQVGTTAAWNGLTAPTMLLSGYIVRDNRLGYNTGNTIPDVSTASVALNINNTAHPIFNGISLSGSLMANPFANIQTVTNTGPSGSTNVLQRGISVITNPYDAGGTVLATVGTPGDAALGGGVIVEFNGGTVMHDTGNTAGLQQTDTLGGHKLIFITGSRENGTGLNGAAMPADAAGIYDLTADGQTMFLNAVNYMAVPEPSTYALLGLGAAAVMGMARRKK